MNKCEHCGESTCFCPDRHREPAQPTVVEGTRLSDGSFAPFKKAREWSWNELAAANPQRFLGKHFIEKSAYDRLAKERDELRAELEDCKRYRDGYGRWESQQVDELKSELKAAREEIE